MVWALASTVGAVAFAAFLRYRRRLPSLPRERLWLVLEPPLRVLRAAHSGHVGDYVAWLTLGTGALGVVFAVTLT